MDHISITKVSVDTETRTHKHL